MSGGTALALHCEAVIDKRAGAYGFEPVECRQTIGLTTLIDAAGVTHRACGRWGHRASLVRRFGETVLPEEPAEPDWTLPEQADPITAAKALHDRDGWPA